MDSTDILKITMAVAGSLTLIGLTYRVLTTSVKNQPSETPQTEGVFEVLPHQEEDAYEVGDIFPEDAEIGGSSLEVEDHENIEATIEEELSETPDDKRSLLLDQTLAGKLQQARELAALTHEGAYKIRTYNGGWAGRGPTPNEVHKLITYFDGLVKEGDAIKIRGKALPTADDTKRAERLGQPVQAKHAVDEGRRCHCRVGIEGPQTYLVRGTIVNIPQGYRKLQIIGQDPALQSVVDQVTNKYKWLRDTEHTRYSNTK